ncbi:cytokine receptor [Stomoxys calcitrans]|uniref:cytokine receptor n=1 Tax=Stomoxys calcitrans TaxID=35570 RepID=UPI0027E316A3|nr:cytokine receptor [Stomoxys calcitrans]
MTNFCKTMVIVLMIMILSHKGLLVVQAYDYFSPGETQPLTVEAAIGDSFNITCRMNPKAFPRLNSSNLYFVNGGTNKDLPPENIVIANSSAIVYMVKNATEQQTKYHCKCGQYVIMETKVFVGTPPKPCTNFTCSSYDFDHMICNFTKPSNTILTTYNVSYYIEMPNYIFLPQCNYAERTLVVCNISLKDRYQEFYHFKIESHNALVKAGDKPLIQKFDINNFEIMIPSKPGENVRVDSVTVDGIRLAWQMPNWEKYRAKGLQWEVLVQPENGTIITEMEPPSRDHNEMRLRLTGLPYAYWRYQLRLRVRVRHPKAQWSEQMLFDFRTAARRPQRPPLMETGGFYINSAETSVTIYWEELKPYEYNGENFGYVIRSVRRDGIPIDLKPSIMDINLATFPWHNFYQYEFEIASSNHMGESFESSRLTIYPFNKLNPKHYTPREINNAYHGNNRTYTLTWARPTNRIGLKSFTVFWCYPKRAKTNECKESMHFQQVPANQLNFTIKEQNPHVEKTLNLAISANYETFNSGLHWTACTMDVDSELVKTDPELTPNVTAIKVQWRVERVCPSILLGFNLTYCEVADGVPADNATCLDEPQSKILRKHDKGYVIYDLKPYTMYKVTMYMFSRKKIGKTSDPQLMRTLEGAPSPPRNLKVFNVTRDSALVRWQEPSQRNGRIHKYIIMLNNEKFEVNASTLEFPLTNLESFTSYKVYVLAQTVQISDTSNDVHFTTDIGYPSLPGHASNSNNVSIVQWTKPAKPNGRLEFYEVTVVQMRSDSVVRQKKSIIMGGETSCFFQSPTCIGTEYQTKVEVKAVNAALLKLEVPEQSMWQYSTEHYYDDIDYYLDDSDDLSCVGDRRTAENVEEIKRYFDSKQYLLYKSEAQTSAIYSCSITPLGKITTIALVVITMSVSMMAALYMARKKYNKMANINCTLPAGLESYFTKDPSNVGFPGDNFPRNTKALEATREAEDQWLSAARRHEINILNEHHRLLASSGNDSGYLGDAVTGRGIRSCAADAISGASIDSSVNDCNGQRNHAVAEEAYDYDKDNMSSSVDSLVESTDESNPQSEIEPRSLSVLFPNENGYVIQEMIPPWQNLQNRIDEPPATVNSNGYITVQSLQQIEPATDTKAMVQNSGYVQQQDLQNFFRNSLAAQEPVGSSISEATNGNPIAQFNSGGYTTLEDIAKLNTNTAQCNAAANEQKDKTPMQSNANEAHTKTITPVSNAMAPTNAGVGGGSLISGYVTQQALNLFAQHQQRH